MDEVFWNGRTGQSVVAWEDRRHLMELARLDFINIARAQVTGADERLEQIPVSRPSSLDRIRLERASQAVQPPGQPV
jgi:hypothetical protein